MLSVILAWVHSNLDGRAEGRRSLGWFAGLLALGSCFAAGLLLGGFELLLDPVHYLDYLRFELQAGAQGGGGAFDFAAGSSSRSQREGPANLVVVATHRETGRMIGHMLGAEQYAAWVYVQPAPMAGPGTPVPGRIDGVVYADVNANRVQELDERGLDDVSINLLNADGGLMDATLTVGDGQFFFDELQAGIYLVEEVDPPGHVSVNSNKQRVELGSGQNQHIQFADQPLPTPTPTPPPTPTPVPTPTHTPTPVPPVTEGTETEDGSEQGGTGGPLPEATVDYSVTGDGDGTGSGNYGDCKCSVHISHQENGPEMEKLPEGLGAVYAVVGFEGCPEGLSYTIRSYYAKTGNEERVDGISTWAGGSGQASVRIKPFTGDSFVQGAYVTFLKIGPENAVCDFRWWFVDPAAAVPSAPQVSYPQSGPAAPSTSAGFGFGRGR